MRSIAFLALLNSNRWVQLACGADEANVIVILANDLGYYELGYKGSGS